MYSIGHDKRIETNGAIYGDFEQAKIGNASVTYHKVFPNEKEPPINRVQDKKYHFFRVNGGIYWEHGPRVNQVNNDVKVFSRLESYGNTSDRFTDFVPRVLVKSSSINANNAFFVNTNGVLCYKDDNGMIFKVNLTPI